MTHKVPLCLILQHIACSQVIFSHSKPVHHHYTSHLHQMFPLVSCELFWVLIKRSKSKSRLYMVNVLPSKRSKHMAFTYISGKQKVKLLCCFVEALKQLHNKTLDQSHIIKAVKNRLFCGPFPKQHLLTCRKQGNIFTKLFLNCLWSSVFYVKEVFVFSFPQIVPPLPHFC